MCDLSESERNAILGHIAALEDLVARIRASGASVEERNWMDHEGLDALLAELADRAVEARGWVGRKVASTHG
jgi:hypothetical protein